MDAFDADVLIYAAVPGHPLGRRVAALLHDRSHGDLPVGVGSILLLPEMLSKPLRDDWDDELAALTSLLARLDLRPVDLATASLAAAMASTYRMRAADAVHLATAVGTGAERFITDNRRDFPASIEEVDVTYPDQLPDVGGPSDQSP